MSELAVEMKKLVGRIKRKEVSFLQVLIQMVLRIHSLKSLPSSETPLDLQADPKAERATLELAAELCGALAVQEVDIAQDVSRMLTREVISGRFGAEFFKNIKKRKPDLRKKVK